MTTVIKKGGKEQKFSPEKIKRAVGKAAKEAKLSPVERRKLIRELAPVIRAVRKRKTIKTSMIAKLVLAKLQRKSKATAAAWRKHAKKHRRKATKRRTVRRKVHRKK